MNPSRGALWNIWVQKGCFCSLAQEQIKYPVSSSYVLATLVDHGREENKKGHHEAQSSVQDKPPTPSKDD